jgi:filamentous hemagglutinin
LVTYFCRAVLRNSVKFDALDLARRILVDAKGWNYANFVDKSGNFYRWFEGNQTLVEQARRQITAAAGETVEWVFAEQRAMEATQRLFQALPPSHEIRQAMNAGHFTMRIY